ncbi:MAG: tyrosine-type recombinase/integrase [Planctomycetota bacterium]
MKTKHQGVRLQRSGTNWQAAYYDSLGRRRCRSLAYLGPISKVSKSKAQRECDAIAAELGADPGSRDRSEPPKLGEWLDAFLRLREPELADSSLRLYKTTSDYLLEFFGPDAGCGLITRGDAEEWRGWLLERVTDETARAHTRRASTIFRRLVTRDEIRIDPFGHLPRQGSASAADPAQLDASMIPKLLDAAQNQSWRNLIAMVCYAGLRLGEAQAMTWDRVVWEGRRLRVPNIKTARATGRREREVLMEPELESVLLRGHELARNNSVILRGMANPQRDMKVIVRRAGLEVYPKPFHAWRTWRSLSWKAQYPEIVVDKWLGHSNSVARQHYGAVPEHYYGGAESETESLRRRVAELESMLKRGTIAADGEV